MQTTTYVKNSNISTNYKTCTYVAVLNSVRLLGISVTNLNIHSKQKPEKPIKVQLKLEF
ncbi:hypothetical protein [Lutibacter sp. HS1-25]|uniref:hypothetical protein n=1 Tax=Lutibacter sp. HS1-25 TaxID=2485000 RepID=UPI0013E993F1|nr:hypothetical protein [Lutibacter sp. HS1-25]